MILRSTGLDKALLKDWPADYDDMAVWSGLMDGLTYEAAKPVTTAMLEQMLKNAASIFTLVPVIIVYLTCQKQFVSGLSISGMK